MNDSDYGDEDGPGVTKSQRIIDFIDECVTMQMTHRQELELAIILDGLLPPSIGENIELDLHTSLQISSIHDRACVYDQLVQGVKLVRLTKRLAREGAFSPRFGFMPIPVDSNIGTTWWKHD